MHSLLQPGKPRLREVIVGTMGVRMYVKSRVNADASTYDSFSFSPDRLEPVPGQAANLARNFRDHAALEERGDFLPRHRDCDQVA